MTNIDTENEVTFDYVGNGYYSLPTLDGLVFEGDVTFADGWVTIPFTTPFTYNGNHLLITVMNDTNDSDNADIYFYVHQKTTWDDNGNSINWVSNGNSSAPMDPTAFPGGLPNSVRNNIQLTFAAAGEGGEEPTPEPEPTPTIPSHPASMTATANGQNSITLTWEAVEGATSYNIYSTAAGNVPAVTATVGSLTSSTGVSGSQATIISGNAKRANSKFLIFIVLDIKYFSFKFSQGSNIRKNFFFPK